MVDILMILVFYFILIMFIISIVGSIIAFLRSEKQDEKLLWITNSIVILLVFLSVLMDFCIYFCSELMQTINLQITLSCSLFVALIASISFISLILGGQRIYKLIK